MSETVARLSRALADRYRVDRELGAGGMATVYLAHDIKHERDVAIKVLHPDLGAALGGDRFLTEIRTTARLQHPHILPVLDSGEADGLLYYVMPLVTGETLRARLERERQLPIADAVRIAREVASALDYALGSSGGSTRRRRGRSEGWARFSGSALTSQAVVDAPTGHRFIHTVQRPRMPTRRRVCPLPPTRR